MKQHKILEIKDLTVSYINKKNNNKPNIKENTIILENLNLTIHSGEIHVIMGPNGAGKSTLANVLSKHPDYNIISGQINYLGHDIATYTPELCAQHGIFLSFQNPISIPGVSSIQFLKSSLNAIRKFNNQKPLDAMDFLALVKQKLQFLNIPEEFLYRSINEDFSGGEKKRNEILQMMLLEPKLAILDEIDSGLDIDALQIVSKGIMSVKTANNAILLITHYERILKYIKPDAVHILTNKKISMSGDHTLAEQLEQKGYGWLHANI